jgi:hypothetical protein
MKKPLRLDLTSESPLAGNQRGLPQPEGKLTCAPISKPQDSVHDLQPAKHVFVKVPPLTRRDPGACLSLRSS